MTNDTTTTTTVDLIRAFAESLDGQSSVTVARGTDGWESLAMVLEFGEGFRSVYGYSYRGDDITPVACNWDDIQPAVDAFLASRYQPGDQLPVKILVQFDRTKGKYLVTFEDTDEERWKVRPKNFREIRVELRPSFD